MRAMLTALVVAALCTLTLPGASTGASAYWGDTARVTASPVRLGPLPIAPHQAKTNVAAPPATPVLGCTASNLLGTPLLSTVSLTWYGEEFVGTPLTYSVFITTRKAKTDPEGPLVAVSSAYITTNATTKVKTLTVGSGLLPDLLATIGGLLANQTAYLRVHVVAAYSAGAAETWTSETMRDISVSNALISGGYNCNP